MPDSPAPVPRIAHVVANLDRLEAGPSYSVAGLASAEARLGADVSVFSLGSGADPANIFRDRRYPMDFEGWPLLGRMRFSSAMMSALVAEDWDVIHDHGLWLMPNIYAARAAERRGARFVLAPRGMLSPVALRFSPMRKRVFGLVYQSRALDRVDMFHATSEAEFEEIRALGFRQPVAIVPNGVEPPDSGVIAGVTEPGKTILSLGRIHPKKGLDRLIRAWARIESERPDWRLRIVGPDEGGHAGELRALVRTLGLGRVEIEGAVFGEAKTRLLAAAEVFVLPTLSENFAMTVAESLAAGTPVISTRGAPWQGLVQQGCGWWIDHGVEPMTEALRHATGLSPEQRAAMGQRGRAWMERDFSWRSVAARMLDAYAWLLSARGAPPDHVRPALSLPTSARWRARRATPMPAEAISCEHHCDASRRDR